MKLHMSDNEQGTWKNEFDEWQSSYNRFQLLKYAFWVADDRAAQSSCWLTGLKCKSCVVVVLLAGNLTMGPRLWPPENNWFNLFEVRSWTKGWSWGLGLLTKRCSGGPSILLTDQWSYGSCSMHLWCGWLLLNWIFNQHRTTPCIVRYCVYRCWGVWSVRWYFINVLFSDDGIGEQIIINHWSGYVIRSGLFWLFTSLTTVCCGESLSLWTHDVVQRRLKKLIMVMNFSANKDWRQILTYDRKTKIVNAETSILSML